MVIQYRRIRYILLKHFRNVNVQIKIKGIINTTLFLENAKVLIDRRKIIFSDGEDKNFIIDLEDIEKIEITNVWHIILKYKNITIDIQQ